MAKTKPKPEAPPEPAANAPSDEERIKHLEAQLSKAQADADSAVKAKEEAEAKASAAVQEATSRIHEEAEKIAKGMKGPTKRKPKVEVVEFYITSSRFITQAGESHSRLIRATPQMPVRVSLPSHYQRTIKGKNGEEDKVVWVETGKTDPGLHRIAPSPPIDDHPGKQGSRGPATVMAPETVAAEGSGVRASDR